MKLTTQEQNYFILQSKPILALEEFQSMQKFVQHGTTSCFEHSLAVAYYSFLLAKRLHLSVDEASLIRGGLLHDFFLYDWHNKDNHQSFHGFRHPRIALKNAQKRFQLTPIECDIISHHMWPLTPVPPRHIEAYLVTFVDKWCSLRETLHKPLRAAEFHLAYAQ